MSRGRGKRRSRPSRAGRGAARARGDVGASIAVAALAAVLVGACLFVDTSAESAFDAPKRLLTVLGVAVAAAAAFLFSRKLTDAGWSWRSGTTEQRVALVMTAAALAIAVVSAILSPRRGISLDSTRTLFLFALVLPLGASRVLGGGRSSILIGAFVG